jgi:hypothetical protein
MCIRVVHASLTSQRGWMVEFRPCDLRCGGLNGRNEPFRLFRRRFANSRCGGQGPKATIQRSAGNDPNTLIGGFRPILADEYCFQTVIWRMSYHYYVMWLHTFVKNVWG